VPTATNILTIAIRLAPRCPHDGDVTNLRANQHHQRREDVEQGDEHDHRKRDEHANLIEGEGIEDRLVQLAPCLDGYPAAKLRDERPEELARPLRASGGEIDPGDRIAAAEHGLGGAHLHDDEGSVMLGQPGFDDPVTK
jgi:hypothetical protein